ncbi:glycoside hydrolase [Exidia glandulosa HHB12029]|uniref:alpha-amylase n=1 Tax=Exidia glandulosa HHB12029 TaxID=1314781 RepID=A0A165N6M6_EXIGL|nr:glycoside hydrolase [Exidia glandulosa HHB12029]
MPFHPHTLSVVLALFLTVPVPATARAIAAHNRIARATAQSDVIVQLFQYNWNSVANECTNYLGPLGYGYAQVSPPHEHILGTQWSSDYAPVSYKIHSKRVTYPYSGTGIGGSPYSPFDYPAVPYTASDFHAECDIDWFNATSIHDCWLPGLSDLRTESDHVRDMQRAYLADLVSLGVDGFRFDAAKWMAVDDIANFLSELSPKPFAVQEAEWIQGSPVQPNDYERNGNVHEFRHTWSLDVAFLQDGGLDSLFQTPYPDWVTSDNANVFVANHDTERSGGDLRSTSSNNAYLLATIYTLAQSYGHPTILSGYDFTDKDAGAPVDSDEMLLDVDCSNGTHRCEQRWPVISAMVKFHNTVSGSDMRRAVAAGKNQISFGRGDVGHVAINYENATWSANIQTDVPDGIYCDVISSCQRTVNVSGGFFAYDVYAYDSVAFHTGEK